MNTFSYLKKISMFFVISIGLMGCFNKPNTTHSIKWFSMHKAARIKTVINCNKNKDKKIKNEINCKNALEAQKKFLNKK